MSLDSDNCGRTCKVVTMKIALFGATGKTGLQLIEQALKRGHSVKALVRNVDKLASLNKKEERLEVLKANVFSAEDLAKHLGDDVDVVVSTLGFAFYSKPVTYVNTVT